MIGIYLIRNKVNNKVYIGQSKNVERRWKEHKSRLDNEHFECGSIFHKALKKYGVENFSFEIIEECDAEVLNEREIYWISVFNSNNPQFGYNLTKGGYFSKPLSLTTENCLEIQQLLRDTKLSQQEIANKFNVSQRLISYINDGTLWVDSKMEYPIRKKKEEKFFCDCGKEIIKGSTHCPKCASLLMRKVERPTKEMLLELIYTYPFSEIGRMYDVSPTTIRRWCKDYGIPHTKKEINVS